VQVLCSRAQALGSNGHKKERGAHGVVKEIRTQERKNGVRDKSSSGCQVIG